MHVMLRGSAVALAAVLAGGCADQDMTNESRDNDLSRSGPSFLVAGASVDIQFEPGEAGPAGIWYFPGKIHLQDDWSSAGPYDHFVVSNAAAIPPYNYPTFGTQSLRLSNAITSGSFGDQTFSKRTADHAGRPPRTARSGAYPPAPGSAISRSSGTLPRLYRQRNSRAWPSPPVPIAATERG